MVWSTANDPDHLRHLRDMDSAANAALTVALDCPRQYECGGVIYEDSEHRYM